VALPRERVPDSSLAFLRDGYEFVTRRCARHGTNAFETRLLGERVVCMQGEEAAHVFYEPGRFTRRRALPPTRA
jgi:fatty-acid peroxygenase